LGSYNGHNGTVWTIDVNWDSTAFVSASADSTVRVWDVQTGRERNNYLLDTPCRCCAFSYDGNMILYTNDDVMGKPCELFLTDIRMRRMSVCLRVFINKRFDLQLRKDHQLVLM
jgi:translation initiation factor 3 subunit I